MKEISKYSKSRQKGNKAEDIACMFLVKRDFSIIQRNYLKYCGEIDIIAEKGGKIHFFEVKSTTVSYLKTIENEYETTADVSRGTINSKNLHVTHETTNHETIRPEENMTKNKLKKLEKTIELYLSEHSVSHETPFQADLITVRMNKRTRIARVEYFEKIL